MNDRQLKGLTIAATRVVRPVGSEGFFVPSEEGSAEYFVRRTNVGLKCPCPDAELQGQGKVCKHVWALFYFRQRQEGKPAPELVPAPPPRKTYPQRWARYTGYQKAEKKYFPVLLSELCAPLHREAVGHAGGRPRLPLADLMVASILKVGSDLSARRVMPELEAAREKGLLSVLPSSNSVLLFIEQEWITPVLEEMVSQSCSPLRAVESDFAVDSTGFGTRMYFCHRVKKLDKDILKEDFIKLHACIGVKSHAITAAVVSEGTANDSPFFKTLVERTSKVFTINEVSADKAYLSSTNLALVGKLGGRAFVPPKKNTREKDTPGEWNLNLHDFNTDRRGYLVKYHKRSNVEAVFSALKRRYKDFIRNKSFTSQRNELLMKVIAYNISMVIQAAFERGIEPTFDLVLPKYTQRSSAL